MLQQPKPRWPLYQPAVAADCCPTCGAGLRELPGIGYDAKRATLTGPGFSVKFPKREAEIFELLWRWRSKGPVSTQMIHDYLYAADPDGGPLDKIIGVYICRMRARLAPTSLYIRTEYHRGYSLMDRVPA